MKTMILIAAGLLSSVAFAQQTPTTNTMDGKTTGSVTQDVKTTTRHTATATHTGTRPQHRMAMRKGCHMRMRHGRKVRICSGHMKPMNHRTTTTRATVTTDTKTKM